jgi:hypothetical protein
MDSALTPYDAATVRFFSVAYRFWRFIRRRTHPKDMLRDKRISILGLGDTNYDKFWCVAEEGQRAGRGTG